MKKKFAIQYLGTSNVHFVNINGQHGSFDIENALLFDTQQEAEEGLQAVFLNFSYIKAVAITAVYIR